MVWTQSTIAFGQAAAPTAGTEPVQWRNYPRPVKAPEGAPNILLVMTDDVGFGSSSTFGGPIPTPTFDALARSGLRYNSFHTTAMCSPTRAALLTGRNSHAVASGSITNISVDEPGYTSVIPDSAATIGRVLRDNGYDTAFFGKNHNTPIWESGPMGPFDRWPIGMGFNYFYGFNGGGDDQFRPSLVENINDVTLPADENYILDRDLIDHMVKWMRVQRSQHPGSPFFAYLAPGTMHSPHQAPDEWVQRFRGAFDMGWDKLRQQIFDKQKAMGIIPRSARLSPRPATLPAWDSLRPEAKRMYAGQMEVAAAQLAFFDDQLGRVIEELRANGELENTLIIYLQGDNGASMGSEHGTFNELQTMYGLDMTEDALIAQSADPEAHRYGYANYSAAWALAQNSPFPWGKQIASHLGGLRDGLVISWPARISAHGEVRDQFHHVIDIAPTIYEAVGVVPPTSVDGVEQQPIDGTSMVYSFDRADAPSTRTEQYFEMLGNRSYYKDGWLASTTPARPPWIHGGTPVDPLSFGWELYDLSSDFSQTRNLAERYPEKLKELQRDFDRAAARNNVYPLAADMIGRVGVQNRPSLLEGHSRMVFYPGSTRYTFGTIPTVSLGWNLDAKVSITGANASGPVITYGDVSSGAGLYLDDGRPVFVYNPTGREQERVVITGSAIAPGDRVIRVLTDRMPNAGPRDVRIAITVDGVEVAGSEVKNFLPINRMGMVGQYGERMFLRNFSNPDNGLVKVDRVEFTRRGS